MLIATWNMQGGTKTADIAQVAGWTGANVLCLQECGNLLDHMRYPVSHGPKHKGQFMIGGGDFMECVYWSNDPYTQGGMAVLTNGGVRAYDVLDPVLTFHPRNVRAMPWMTVESGGTVMTVISIHSPPVWPPVTVGAVCGWNNAQMMQINHVLGGTWACVGDYNVEPGQPGYVPPSVGVVVRGQRGTHEGGKQLDYAVTNGHLASMVLKALPGAADHYPQVFRTP